MNAISDIITHHTHLLTFIDMNLHWSNYKKTQSSSSKINQNNQEITTQSNDNNVFVFSQQKICRKSIKRYCSDYKHTFFTHFGWPLSLLSTRDVKGVCFLSSRQVGINPEYDVNEFQFASISCNPPLHTGYSTQWTVVTINESHSDPNPSKSWVPSSPHKAFSLTEISDFFDFTTCQPTTVHLGIITY